MKAALVFAPYALPSGLAGEAFLVSGYVPSTLYLYDGKLFWSCAR